MRSTADGLKRGVEAIDLKYSIGTCWYSNIRSIF
jgi:hypothetical protein